MTYQSFSISGWGSSPRISSGPPAGASSPPASTAAAPCSERSTAPASSAMSIRSGARPRADSPSPPQPAHQGKELVHDQVHETEKHRDDRDRHQRHDGVGDQFLSVGPYDLPQLGTGFADEPAYSRRKRRLHRLARLITHRHGGIPHSCGRPDSWADRALTGFPVHGVRPTPLAVLLQLQPIRV